MWVVDVGTPSPPSSLPTELILGVKKKDSKINSALES